MEPFLSGSQAYKDGKPCSACPFKSGHRKAEWERGWWAERLKDGAPAGIVK
jgi:hypothetical protein